MAVSNPIQKNLDWQLIIILLVAAYIRFLLLDLRPPHHDEGVNGWFADQLTENGFYRYDPTNYHGPLNFYILFVFKTLLGNNLWVLRLPTVIISLLSIYWIALFAPFLGRTVVLIAALAFSLSPANVYYARFVNIDALLVFFQILILWGIIGLWKEGTKKYLWAIGLGICGMILTKETYIIHVICFILAIVTLNLWEKVYPSEEISKVTQVWTKRDLSLVIVTCVGLIIFFYSGTFLNLNGLTDLFKTFEAWFTTGAKQGGHEKSFGYWLTLFLQYEQIGLLGFIGCIRYVFPSSRQIRLIAIYGLGVLLVYSIVRYKTPWLIVNLLWPFYFVFGDIIMQIIKTRFRVLTIITCLAVYVISLIISIRLSFIDYINHKEPYVYVHTFNYIKSLTKPLFELTNKDPSNYYTLTGNILRSDEWPLPWTLRDFTMVYYYSKERIPPTYDADFLFVESSRINEVEENLQKKYFTKVFQLRDAQEPSKLYLRYETFKDVFSEDQFPEFVPEEFEQSKPGQGILALFYSNATWSGSPTFKKVFKNIDFYWEGIDRPLLPPFSIKFIGDINIEPDTTLLLATDDGGYLELDGIRVIDDPGPHAEDVKSINLKEKSGWYKIEVGFYDLGGGAIVRLKKFGRDGSPRSISPNNLRFDEKLL